MSTKAAFSLVIVLVLVSIAALITILPKPASAQAPPQPPPEPVSGCCGVMQTTGKTIGGPGSGTIPNVFSGTPEIDVLLKSPRRVDLCVTVRNTGNTPFRLFLAPGARSDPRFEDSFITEGRIVTRCAQAGFVMIECPDLKVGCAYQWRIDTTER